MGDMDRILANAERMTTELSTTNTLLRRLVGEVGPSQALGNNGAIIPQGSSPKTGVSPQSGLALREDLRNHTRGSVVEDDWVASGAASSGATTIAVNNTANSGITVGDTAKEVYRGALIIFRTGQNAGWRTTITDISSSGNSTTLTLGDPLGANVQSGDELTIMKVGGTGSVQGSFTDGSGTITTGGTSQQVFASNEARRYLYVQNNAASGGDTLYVNFGVDAVQGEPSIQLTPGSAFVLEAEFISTEAVNIIGPTTGDSFTAKEA